MSYNPALDGLRAVAIILVMLFHARTPGFSGGFLGVDVFFVLSGYLITTILLTERDQTGTLNIGRFYLKRLLRLTPALVAMLVAFAAFAPLLWPNTVSPLLQAGIALAYLSDYSVAFWKVPVELSHTWSLAVEEHFYLLWPLALLALCRRYTPRQLVTVLFIAYAVAATWRWLWLEQGHTWHQVYYRFDTHASGLLLGACLAAALRVPALAAAMEKHRMFLMWLPFAALACLAGSWRDEWMLTWGIGLAEWGTLAILLATHRQEGWTSNWLAAPALVWTGRLSYSLYLWHYPVFRYLRADLPWYQVLLIGVPIATALAALSYFTVERWGLRLRDALKRKATAAAEPTSPAFDTSTEAQLGGRSIDVATEVAGGKPRA
jgi:peptidoglycan/LPS O-acetylase OafA/YrhL